MNTFERMLLLCCVAILVLVAYMMPKWPGPPAHGLFDDELPNPTYIDQDNKPHYVKP